MWKVRRLEDADRIVLRLSGRLECGQLNELEDVFASEAAVQPLILDLTDIRLVDKDAVHFLAEWEASGASLRNCPAYIREWIAAENAAKMSYSVTKVTRSRNHSASDKSGHSQSSRESDRLANRRLIVEPPESPT